MKERENAVGPNEHQLTHTGGTTFRILVWLFSIAFACGYCVDEVRAHNLTEIKALFPSNSVTRVAKGKGRWSDPASWLQKVVPGAADVVQIPAGASIEYDLSPQDLKSSQRLAGIIIEDGAELWFAPSATVKLTVDTIIGLPGSTFRVGSKYAPIEAAATVEVVFDSGGVGSFDRRGGRDPLQLGLGALFIGNTVEIHGSVKSPFLKLAGGATAGTASLTLADSPQGWRAGDSVIITATYNTYGSTTQEVRTLQSVTGRTIVLDRALSEDHLPGPDNVPVFIANATRNVIFRSSGGPDTPTYHRGHMMITDAGTYHLDAASFVGMGRTRKDQLLDGDGIEYVPDGGYIMAFKKDEHGNRVPGPQTNVKGRYPLHFHFIQLDPETTDPATASNLAVVNSPGWSIASHQSYADIVGNVSYDIQGSHFVFEDGNELGTVKGNIAVKTRGALQEYANKQRRGVHDFGHDGGFWFQGRNLRVEDNVAAGIPGVAFEYFHRSDIVSPPTKARDVPDLPIEAAHGAVDNLIDLQGIPLMHVDRNVVVGASQGFSVVKSNADQGHDIRTHITHLSIFNVETTGIHIEYTARYTIDDSIVTHRNWSGEKIWEGWEAGLSLGHGTFGMLVNRATIKGWLHPIFYNPESASFGGTEDFLGVDIVTLDNSGAVRPTTITQAYPATFWQLPQPEIDLISSSKLRSGFDITDPQGDEFLLPTAFNTDGGKTSTEWWNFAANRTISKKDSGPFPITQYEGFFLGTVRERLTHGHYTDTAGRRWLPLVSLFSDRVNPESRVGRMWKLLFPADMDAYWLGPDLGSSPTPPSISTGPMNVSAKAGTTAIFKCLGEGQTLPVSYSWEINGREVAEARYPTLRIRDVPSSMNGAKVTCRVTNFFGSAKSAPATLAVTDPDRPGAPTALRVVK